MSLALVREPDQEYAVPSNKHDTGYKYLLANKSTFLQFLQTFVKAEWVKGIQAKDVMLIPKSFILQDFRHQEADLIYRLRLAEQDVYFYLLLELQSTVDQMMPFRLLMYMVEIWRIIGSMRLPVKGVSLCRLLSRACYTMGKAMDGDKLCQCQAGFLP